MEFADDCTGFFEVHADERRRKIFLRHDLHRFQGLVGIAGPPLGRFAPAFDTVFGLDPDDQRAAIFEEAGGAAIDLFDRQHE